MSGITQKQRLSIAQTDADHQARKAALLQVQLDNAIAALKKVNDTLFAAGAPLGSENYFIVRQTCCDILYPNVPVRA